MLPAGRTPLLIPTGSLICVAESLGNTVQEPGGLALPLAPGCNLSVTQATRRHLEAVCHGWALSDYLSTPCWLWHRLLALQQII